MRSALDLLDELNALDESARIEAKRAGDLGKSVMETVIAFANEPGLGGGYLLLGVDWSVNPKGDTVYRAVGLPDPDKVQRDLASQCASMLNVALRPEMQLQPVDGKTVLVVFVPEADVSHKPIYKKATGLPAGAWRRIGSSDQRCVDEDLWVLRGTSQPLHGPDSSILPDARMEDFDPAALAAYRRERARINPQAEELGYDDTDLLEALCALRRSDGELKPTLAGLLLFGKPMALRRMLPMVKIDYIRVPGLEWMENPHERFQSVEIRKPLLLALPQAEATVVDELPRGFYLPEGQLHSVQEPIVPRKVIREALANAVMHRSYTRHSPIQIIRYSNRIEIRNIGYSLKPMTELGTPGSCPRNPLLAAVLHDLNLAEAKGTGIRSMRRLAAEAGLTLPEFQSRREADSFCVTLFLHNLLNEDDHAWLRSLTTEALDADEVKVLIYVRATGAVDNAACRDFSGLDTLTASRVLRRLRDLGLLEKQGSGNATYYTLSAPTPVQSTLAKASMGYGLEGSKASMLDMEACNPGIEGLADGIEGLAGNLPVSSLLQRFPPQLATQIATQRGKRQSRDKLCTLLLELCSHGYTTLQELEILLDKHRNYLMIDYIRPLVRSGQLKLRYPETAKHPHQAYLTAGAEDKNHG